MQVLSDPEMRKRYDQFGKDGLEEGSTHNAEDIFSMFFGGGRRQSGPRKGEDIRHPLKVSLEHARTSALQPAVSCCVMLSLSSNNRRA